MHSISISKKKPKNLLQVLIYDAVNEWVIGYYDKRSGRFIGSVDGARIASPRYWRSLPALPEQFDKELVSTSVRNGLLQLK